MYLKQTSYTLLSKHFTSGKCFLGRPFFPLPGTSACMGFSFCSCSCKVSCSDSDVKLGWLASTGAKTDSFIVRALEKLFQYCARVSVSESFRRAPRILTTPPCDFVIALEFFSQCEPRSVGVKIPVPRTSDSRIAALNHPFQVNVVVFDYGTQIIGKFTIVWSYANWLIQL